MFDNGCFSNGNENFIKQVRDMLIIKALESGKHVIVDDTNLTQKSITRINQLVDEFNKLRKDTVTVEIKDMNTSMEECIERDSLRENKVGEEVIRKMQRQLVGVDERYVQQDEKLPKAIICDLDGTLALLKRSPHNATLCETDLLNQPVFDLISKYGKDGYQIILLSGREDTFKPQTLNWLEKYKVAFHLLLMRKEKDQRKDSIVKREIFETFVKDKYRIDFILDDRNQVVDMWRDELRLPCFQVYYGDF
jgi:predicted kinase